MSSQSGEVKVDKKCFIITPIGGNSSDIRRKADGVIETVITPLLEKLDFSDVKAAHQINLSGSINNQIVSRIIDDDLVIANLTGLNPNVMYELAIRHATMKPIIHICEHSTNLPFDIKDQRTIIYTDDILGAKELENSLTTMVIEVMKQGKCDDNPIYSAVKRKIIENIASEDQNIQIQKFILDKIDSIEEKLNNSLNKNTSGWPSWETKDIRAYTSHKGPSNIIKFKLNVFAPRDIDIKDIKKDIEQYDLIEVMSFEVKKSDEKNNYIIFDMKTIGGIVFQDVEGLLDTINEGRTLPYKATSVIAMK